MNLQQIALQNWKQQTITYLQTINSLIKQLEQPLQLPSQYSKMYKSLQQFLQSQQLQKPDQKYLQIYAYHIIGQRNITLMQLSARLAHQIGGTIIFWQNKINQIGEYINYNPSLSIWQINKTFLKCTKTSKIIYEQYMNRQQLIRKYYLSLTSICKIIDKTKPFHEDLLKIDQNYIKLKKNKQNYENYIRQSQRLSKIKQKYQFGLLWMEKNMLQLYKMGKKDYKDSNIDLSFDVQNQLKKGKQYQQLNLLFENIRCKKHQFIRDSRNGQNSILKTYQIGNLRQEFTNKNQLSKNSQYKGDGKTNHTFIWSREYYFSYEGFLTNYSTPIDYSKPFTPLVGINYQIDSQQQFDELNAQDIGQQDEYSSQSLAEGSPHASDREQSDRQNQSKMNQKVKFQLANFFKPPWIKYGVDLKQYELITLNQNSSLPLRLEEQILDIAYIDQIDKMDRNQIDHFFQSQSTKISKIKINNFLKKYFKKTKQKDRKIIYTKLQNNNADQSKHISMSQTSAISSISSIQQLSENDETFTNTNVTISQCQDKLNEETIDTMGFYGDKMKGEK